MSLSHSKFNCLFLKLFKPHEQFYNYLAAVTITVDRACTDDFWFVYVPHLLRHGTPFLKACDSHFLMARSSEGAISPYFNVTGRNGALTQDLPISSQGLYHFATATGFVGLSFS
jgi:hypothetical protein